MKKYDFIVLGSGPAAIEFCSFLNHTDLKICMVEKDPKGFGGVCVNKGCMPTKHLVKTAEIMDSAKKAKEYSINIPKMSFEMKDILSRKNELVSRLNSMHHESSNVDVLFGYGRFLNNQEIEVTHEDGSKEVIEGEKILIATGSRPIMIPSIKIDGTYVCTSDEMLDNETIPESLLIVGGGVIGLEFASIYNSLGSKVTIVEFAPVIMPNEDRDTSILAAELLEKKGILIHTSTSLQSSEIINGKVECVFKGDTLNSNSFDKVLVGIGRTPNTDDLGLENTSIVTEKGFISVDDFLQTSEENVFAVGDVIPTLMLAHTATYESMVLVSNILKPKSRPYINKVAPRVVYTKPEIASVGYTEKEAQDLFDDVKVINFPMIMNGKNVIEHETDGRIKLIFKGEEKTIIGANIIGRLATELIHELTLAVTHNLTLDDLIDTVHAHPTVSEIIWFAVLKGQLLSSTQKS